MQTAVIRFIFAALCGALLFVGVVTSASTPSASADISATAFVTDPVGITTQGVISSDGGRSRTGLFLRLPGHTSVLMLHNSATGSAPHTYINAIDSACIRSAPVADGDTLTLIPTGI